MKRSKQNIKFEKFKKEIGNQIQETHNKRINEIIALSFPNVEKAASQINQLMYDELIRLLYNERVKLKICQKYKGVGNKQ